VIIISSIKASTIVIKHRFDYFQFAQTVNNNTGHLAKYDKNDRGKIQHLNTALIRRILSNKTVVNGLEIEFNPSDISSAKYPHVAPITTFARSFGFYI